MNFFGTKRKDFPSHLFVTYTSNSSNTIFLQDRAHSFQPDVFILVLNKALLPHFCIDSKFLHHSAGFRKTQLEPCVTKLQIFQVASKTKIVNVVYLEMKNDELDD